MKVLICLVFLLFSCVLGGPVVPMLKREMMRSLLIAPGDWYMLRYGHGDDFHQNEYVELLEFVPGMDDDSQVVGYIRRANPDKIEVYAGTKLKGVESLGVLDVDVLEESDDPRILARMLGWNKFVGKKFFTSRSVESFGDSTTDDRIQIPLENENM